MSAESVSTIVLHWMETAAIAVGGTWAVWNWGFTEFIKPLIHGPAIDGEISVETEIADQGRVAVTVRSVWNNRSKFSIGLDAAACKLTAFAFDPAAQPAPLDIPAGMIRAEIAPFAHREGLELEPETNSSFHAFLVLHPGETLVLRWLVVTKANRRGRQYRWMKETLWRGTSAAEAQA